MMDDVQVPGAQWYVIHTYSGYENKVKTNLERRVESMAMEDKIFQVVVPVEEEMDFKDGKKKLVKKKIFPGYVLVQMIMRSLKSMDYRCCSPLLVQACLRMK